MTDRGITHLMLGRDQKLFTLAEVWKGQIPQKLSQLSIISGERLLLQAHDFLVRGNGILGRLVCELNDSNLSRIIRDIRRLRPGTQISHDESAGG